MLDLEDAFIVNPNLCMFKLLDSLKLQSSSALVGLKLMEIELGLKYVRAINRFLNMKVDDCHSRQAGQPFSTSTFPRLQPISNEVPPTNLVFLYPLHIQFQNIVSNLESIAFKEVIMFVKEYPFSLVLAVGKPVQLDQAAINKTKPSYARVKVLVDIKAEFPNSVRTGIVNEATGKMRTEVIQIRYDYVPNYSEE
ncbi:hypothetical protein H5410_027144 [Solanum commersonii]|uniref:Uncharacterized protein n=1 Tax=Solanum commersonii TaxID=4109 RepID=A0A9J5Z2K8_SOLCO|nr:hypothetical protein H5410_027144 [Solanum commersonii]